MNPEWDPDAPAKAQVLTNRQAFALMAERVELAREGSGAGYTPAIRRAEDAYDAAPPDRAGAALVQLEEAWLVEIARARRLAARSA